MTRGLSLQSPGLVHGEIMKPIPFKMKGTEYALTVKIATYPEGNLAIKLYQESFGQLVFWDSLTVNLAAYAPKIAALSTPKPPASGIMPGSSATV